MPYNKNIWVAGDVITARKINIAENQIEALTNEVEAARVVGGSANGTLGKRLDNMADDFDEITDEVASLRRSTINSNTADIIALLPHPNKAATDSGANGISYTWNDSKCTINGTVNAGAIGSVYRFFNDAASLPDGISPGNSYYVKYESVNVYLNIKIFKNNDNSTENRLKNIYFLKNGNFKVPEDATGMEILFWIQPSTTVNETVLPILGEATNQSFVTNLAQYNVRDVLAEIFKPSDESKNNVTFVWNEDVCTVSTTDTGASALTVNDITGYTLNTIPAEIIPGNTYPLKYTTTDTQIVLRIRFYADDGTTVVGTTYANKDINVTIPDGAVKWAIGLYINEGTILTESATVSNIHFLNAKTTTELESEIKQYKFMIHGALPTNSDLDEITEPGWYALVAAYNYFHLPEEMPRNVAATLEVIRPAWLAGQAEITVQRIINNVGNEIYVRQSLYNTLVGSAWHKVAETDVYRKFSVINFEPGSWAYGAKSSTYQSIPILEKYIRSKTAVPVKAGMKVHYTNPTHQISIGITRRLEGNNSLNDFQTTGWIDPSSKERIYTIQQDGYMTLVARKNSDMPDFGLEDYNAEIYVSSYLYPDFNSTNYNEITHTVPDDGWSLGIINDSTGERISTVQYVCCSNKILHYDRPVFICASDKYAVAVSFYNDDNSYIQYSRTLWTSYGVYIDANRGFKINAGKYNIISKTLENIGVINIKDVNDSIHIIDSPFAQSIEDSFVYHKNPMDYKIMQKWITAIMEPVQIKGDGLPTDDQTSFPDGMTNNSLMIGTNYSASYNRDADLYFNSTLASWHSMLKNPVSKIFTDVWTWKKDNIFKTSYYGGVCSTFVSYLLGQDIFYKADEYYSSCGLTDGMSEQEKKQWADQNRIHVSWLNNDLFELKDIKSIAELDIGDVYALKGHVGIISDVGCNENGYYTVLFEQTYPKPKLTLYNNTTFFAKLNSDNARICHVKNHYSIRDPREIDLEYCKACIPNRGDKSVYFKTEPVLLYVPNVQDNVQITVKHFNDNNATWESVAGFDQLTPVTEYTNDAGESVDISSIDGKAYLLNFSSYNEGKYSLSVDNNTTCSYIYIVSPGEVIINQNQNAFSCIQSPYCQPLWYTVMYFGVNHMNKNNLPNPSFTTLEDYNTTNIEFLYKCNLNNGYYNSYPYLGTKTMITSSNSTRVNDEITVNLPETFFNTDDFSYLKGWYIRVDYKTPYGLIHVDSSNFADAAS